MTTPPLHLTKARTLGAEIAVIGDAQQLHAAFAAGEPVTLDGKLAGERVYLGYRHQIMGDGGITVETVGLDHTIGEVDRFPGHTIAAYCVDLTRLNDAPRLAEQAARVHNQRLRRVAGMEQRLEQEDRDIAPEDLPAEAVTGDPNLTWEAE